MARANMNFVELSEQVQFTSYNNTQRLGIHVLGEFTAIGEEQIYVLRDFLNQTFPDRRLKDTGFAATTHVAGNEVRAFGDGSLRIIGPGVFNRDQIKQLVDAMVTRPTDRRKENTYPA